MAWVSIGLGAAGAIAGGVGAMSANKNRAKPGSIQKYDGPRPPSVGSSLRPVQTMITDTLMRRSQGQDVGFDPKRREELQKIYDIDYNRNQESTKSDLMNQLSGTGQSRNLAARDALLGQAQRYGEDTRSKYLMGLDVEDLTRRSDDVRGYTQQLQNLNQQNFGQENAVANFGLDEARYNAGAVTGNYSMQDQYAQQYQNPWASALSGAAKGANMGSGFGGGMGGGGFQEKAGTSGSYGTDIGTTSGRGVRQNYFNAAPKRVLKA